ncbi:MAG: hypothetical protein OEZ43_11285 [Gammaproteobacteria bacterium]|nr:hypothetical protein [Gammaproteobacteria bacterium]
MATRTNTFGLVVLLILVYACANETIPTYDTQSPGDAKISSRGLSEWSAPQRIGGETLPAGSTGYLHGPVVGGASSEQNWLAWNLYQGNSEPQLANSQQFRVARHDLTSEQTQTFDFLSIQQPAPVTLPRFQLNSITSLTSALWVSNGELLKSYDVSAGGNPVSLGLAKEGWEVDGQYVWWNTTATGIGIYTSNIVGTRSTLLRDGVSKAIFAEPKKFSPTSVLLNWVEVDSLGVARNFSAFINVDGQPVFGAVIEIGRKDNPTGEIVFAQTVVSTPSVEAHFFVQYSDFVLGDSVTQANFYGNQWSDSKYVFGLGPMPDRGIRGPIKAAGNFESLVLAYIEELISVDTITTSVKTVSIKGGSWEPQSHGIPLVRSTNSSAQNAEYSTYFDLAFGTEGDWVSLGPIHVLVWVENRGNTSELKSVHNDSVGLWSQPETIATYDRAGIVENPAVLLRQNKPIAGPIGVRNQVYQADIYWKTSRPENNAIVFDIYHSTTTLAVSVPDFSNRTTSMVVTPGMSKPSNHLPTSENCLGCHLPDKSVSVSHDEVLGICEDCHNNILAAGKEIWHFPSSNSCGSCHSSNRWVPVIFIDHDEKLSPCYACHSGLVAPGKSSSHIPSTLVCETCHSSDIWSPVTFVDHSYVIGVCSDCHNNSIAFGLPASHISISEECDACHTTKAWLPLKLPEPTPGLPPTHIATTDNCVACHSITSWIPVIRVDHKEVLGACSSCHNGVTAIGKPANHVPASNVCENCHGTGAWLPAIGGI